MGTKIKNQSTILAFKKTRRFHFLVWLVRRRNMGCFGTYSWLSTFVIFASVFCIGAPVVFAQREPKPTPLPDVIEQLKKEIGIKPTPSPIPRSTVPLTARQVVQRVMPSVVLVVAQDEKGESIAQGSGFFYKPGLVATNLHVFQRATKGYIKVLSSGEKKVIIEVVAIDIRHDICVVRVYDSNTPVLVLNSGQKPSIGDEVYVVSNPKGLEGSVSKGIISAQRADMGLLQIDAAISPGSSGGAVVDDRAEVIGIAVSSLVGGQNLNFAIPSRFLGSLLEKYRVPLFVAGAFALNDRAKEHLKGLVREFVETKGTFAVDIRTGDYYEKSAVLSDKKVFDINGNRTEDWEYISGEFWWKYLNTYDENGFLTRQIIEYPDGHRTSYEYTLQESISKRINEKGFSDVNETEISKTVYDRNGNETDLTATLANGTTKRWVSSYDKYGFLIERKIYSGEVLESVSRFKYDADDNGNWIRRYETGFSYQYPDLGFTPISTTYRSIAYF